MYGNLGERVAAGLLDGLFLCPVTLGALYFNSTHLNNYYYTFAIIQLVVIGYHIYLPVRFGATPGKRVMGLTILKQDGSAITYKESFLKYLPMVVFGLFAFVIQCWSIAQADAAVYESLPWIQQTKYLQTFNPIPTWIQTIPSYGYFVGSLVLVAINDRHQSLSDAIAGTVVVYTRCLDQIAEYLEKGEDT